MMANKGEPICKCGKRISVGYTTEEGTLCPDCYKAGKINQIQDPLIDELYLIRHPTVKR